LCFGAELRTRKAIEMALAEAQGEATSAVTRILLVLHENVGSLAGSWSLEPKWLRRRMMIAAMMMMMMMMMIDGGDEDDDG